MSLQPASVPTRRPATCERYEHYGFTDIADFSVPWCDDVMLARGRQGHRSVYQVQTETSRFLVETIESSQPTHTPRTLTHIPGLSENIVHNFARNRVLGIMQQAGFDRAVSIGHNGMGIPGGRDISDRISTVRERNQLLAQTTRPSERLTALASSMGAILLIDMLAEKPAIDIDRIVLFGPAIQSKQKLTVKKGFDFVVQVTGDTGRDLVRRGPMELGRESGHLVDWLTSTVRSRQPITNQLFKIIRPTSIEVVEDVLQDIPTSVLYGTKDKIVDTALWDHIEQGHPRTFTRQILPRKGHEILNDPAYSAQLLSQLLVRGSHST